MLNDLAFDVVASIMMSEFVHWVVVAPKLVFLGVFGFSTEISGF